MTPLIFFAFNQLVHLEHAKDFYMCKIENISGLFQLMKLRELPKKVMYIFIYTSIPSLF